MDPRNWQPLFTHALFALLLLTFSSIVLAYPDYNGCQSCHGSFDGNNYTSKTDGAAWNKNLMEGHETFVGGKCNACHKDGSKSSVYLNYSIDSTLSKSCVGCHGREQDVNGSCVNAGGMQVECGAGAGLRKMHELNVGAGTCNSCHSGDPIPVGEQNNPFDYGKSGVQMLNACDADSSESRYGTLGLDNDGDGQVDGSDSDCQVANSLPTQPGTLSASAVTGSSATVSWGASTDADGDTITYQVDYRKNGDVSWSSGGSTTTTSRALSSLSAGTSYDVRVTPNDGTGDGPVRSATNLFQTVAVVNNLPTQPGILSASAVTSSSATVSWGASTDADGDTITYQVDYRKNGDVSWSSGGSTTSTSKSLTGLNAEQSYDVRVTPNDGIGDGPDRTASSLFQTTAPVQSSCLDMGALAYDDWTKTDAGGSGSLPAGAVSADYVRCKSCHGWDHMGLDGGYVRRSRTADRPNAGAGDSDQTSRNISLAGRNDADVTADMIQHTGTGRLFTEGAGSWVPLDDSHSAANKAAHSEGYTLGNQHPDFTSGSLTQDQIDCLVEFLNSPDADPSAYFSNIDTGTDPALYSIDATANAASGESYYNANCFSCHGDPAGVSPAGSPAGGILAYLQGDGKFSEFAHKARWGIPNTSMTRSAMGSPDATDVADMMLWLQQLGGNGFAINPGLIGTWWGGAPRAGEGFLIDVANNIFDETILVVSFYTYDSIGNQVWLIGRGAIHGNTVVLDLLMPEGAKWGADFVPDDRTEIPWGSGTFSFTSCGAGHIALEPNEVMQANGFTNLEYDINRELLIPAIECPMSSQ